jgi:ribosomal protein L11 methyltransferase
MSQAVARPVGTWWQLTLPVPQRWGEDASACLIEAGALGVQTVGDSSEPIPKFAQQGLLPQAPSTLLAGQVLLLASYAPDQDAAAIRAGAVAALASLRLEVAPQSMQLAKRDNEAWADRWKHYFKPLKVGRRIWIVPSWEKEFVAPAHTLVLELDPGMAFGTGQHATTAMCLKALELYAERLVVPSRPSPNLCDLGCGSGILAIAAAKLGFAPILALDLDPEAVRATVENAQHNKVELAAHTTPIEQIDASFSVVVANILAQPLIDLAAPIAGRLKPGGWLIVSGLLKSQADDVQCAFEKTGILEHRDRWTQGDWSALGFKRLGKH